MKKLTAVLVIILLSAISVLAQEQTTTEPLTTTITVTTTEPATTTEPVTTTITTSEPVTTILTTTTEIITTTVPTETTTVAGVVCGNGICEPAEDRGGTYECIVDCGMDCDGDGKKESWDCRRAVCGDRICDEGLGEDPFTCPQDCMKKCPDSKVCPDETRVPCYFEEKENACRCEGCPEEIPPGCRKEVDAQGYVRVVCEKRCPDVSSYEKDRCIAVGGNPILRKDSAGCDFIDCQLQPAPDVINPITGYGTCPPEEEIENVLNKCEVMGKEGRIVWEGGCKIAKCIQEGIKEMACPMITPETKMDIEDKCKSEDLEVVRTFDQNGCPVLDCSFEDCSRDVPPEAYEKCNERSGELVVKRDDRECIVFSDCIMRGDERMAYVKQIEEVPEATELLAMAFKLEELKVELDKLSRQADDIANYYASVRSPEEERFRRVSDMFLAAKNKVDEIKMKLRERIDSITVDDMMEIRSDIRYIKDVMFKDILYVMLSTSEDMKEITMKTESDCGEDSGCFNRAFRVCKPIVFYPEGRDNVRIEIVGVEDNKCIMNGELPEDKGPPPEVMPDIKPPYWMKCSIPDYSLGVRGPEDILPYCEGPLVELTKMAPPSRGGPTVPETVEPGPSPGSCWCEDNRECERFECKSCLDCGGPGCVCEDNGRCEQGECPECKDCRTAGQEIREACSGCLDNGVCDPGECSYCRDCGG